MACDNNFHNLLCEDATIKRPSSTVTINEYGEVIIDYDTAPVIANIKTRLDPEPGRRGLTMQLQGKAVLVEFKAFVCRDIDILENDLLIMGTREYLVIYVEEFFDYGNLHHKEVLLKRTDRL